MKRFLKKKVLIEAAIYVILAIVVFSIASAIRNGGDEPEPKEKVAGVSIETISIQRGVTVPIKLSGQVKAKQSTSIRALAQGTVQQIAPVGSTVSLGQQLFRLTNSSIETNYLTALSSLSNAQASFSQTKLASDTSLNQVELSVKQAEVALEQARAQLKDAEVTNNISKRQAEDSARVAYDSGYRTIETVIRFLGGPNLNDYIYEDILSNDVNILGDIRNLFSASVNSFNLLSRQPNGDLLKAINNLETTLISVKDLTRSTWTFLRLAVPGPGYSEASLNTAVLSVGGYIDQLNGTDTQVKLAKNSLNATQEQAVVTIANLERQIELSEISLANTKNALNAQSVNAQLSQLGSSSQLNGAQAQLAGARFQFENLALPSPFAGTVISHGTSVGSQVSPGQEILEIGNLDIIEIRVEVFSSALEAVVLGQTVLINGQPVGRISEIEAAADLATGKVGIKVEADNSSKQFISGSIAEVEFNLVYDTTETIFLPLKYVKVGQNNKKVLVMVDGKVSEKEVELGQLFGDLVEITEGLYEGDLVIIENGDFLKAGDKVEVKK
ncbi:MAG: hypothetical protein COT91_02020 [Candidatus Doudnabacteria bacterium CG10_big_fil_rev_8_21_14_0_10_41_10]|uniref:Multidrug resistance protein MdtA-like C-terminal permuted SH3 domain-containing protein n=1 Tax=Candidatus Doudnabacteria bacterium CG10_big_fil_rev_8_21_14_0_10_41_10 TaxID=1974551 RepID=A0A2H0VE02_9BACT|nr:MAG: hypothetical protein COT91_02020 [Candidatus Doudnabacteria bacterium CG10_big_fil_rev_8_21_14_0_10_41_10]